MEHARYNKQYYSDSVVDAILAAPNKSVGVELGRLCVDKDYSIADVADYLGVTRMTVYSWFYGYRVPRNKNLTKVVELINKIRGKTTEESNAHDNQTSVFTEHTAS